MIIISNKEKIMFSRIVKWLKSEICSIWYYYLPIDNKAIEQEIEEFLAMCRTENLTEELEREREGEDQYQDYLVQRRAEEDGQSTREPYEDEHQNKNENLYFDYITRRYGDN